MGDTTSFTRPSPRYIYGFSIRFRRQTWCILVFCCPIVVSNLFIYQHFLFPYLRCASFMLISYSFSPQICFVFLTFISNCFSFHNFQFLLSLSHFFTSVLFLSRRIFILSLSFPTVGETDITLYMYLSVALLVPCQVVLGRQTTSTAPCPCSGCKELLLFLLYIKLHQWKYG
jgi:hypothetical protein